MELPKVVEDFLGGDDFWVVDDVDDFVVAGAACADVFVGGIFGVAGGVA